MESLFNSFCQTGFIFVPWADFCLFLKYSRLHGESPRAGYSNSDGQYFYK